MTCSIARTYLISSRERGISRFWYDEHMKILSIETSCDETAVSIIEAVGDFPYASYTVLGNALFSQIDIHREYGGVFPALAKREHAKTLVPMLEKALGEAQMLTRSSGGLSTENETMLHEILIREPGLGDTLAHSMKEHARPPIDLIAVTTGPGLEPALWVGINFARALGTVWEIPVVPVNHMEGHILSSVFDGAKLPEVHFPAISLLISGGHTELILMRDWLHYEKIGETRDDAVGEAFDKVARMLGLPYPGGPEISILASQARVDADGTRKDAEREPRSALKALPLPRPMINTNDFDFSFSGLKTAVRYAIEKKGSPLTEEEREMIAQDFEESITEVLLAKTKRAVDHYGAHTVIVGGGVSANTYIREVFTRTFKTEYPELALYFPPRNLSTDNSIMIALAGHAQHQNAVLGHDTDSLHANGNLELKSRI